MKLVLTANKINMSFELKHSFNVKRLIPDLLGPFIFYLIALY